MKSLLMKGLMCVVCIVFVSNVNESVFSQTTHTVKKSTTPKKNTVTKQSTPVKTPVKTVKKNVDTIPVFNARIFDKIILRNNDSLVVKIVNRTQDELTVVYPLNIVQLKIKIKRIKRIYFSNGQIENITYIPGKDDEEDEHEGVTNKKTGIDNIWITYSPDSVKGMVEKGMIATKYEAETLNADNHSLEVSGIRMLKGKASYMDASCILIKYIKVHREYGEAPFIEMEGIAYKIKKK